MNDDTQDLLGTALRDEPPLGIHRSRVLAAGRRRVRLRQAGLVGGVMSAVAAVAVAALVVADRPSGGEPAASGSASATAASGASSNPDPAPPGRACTSNAPPGFSLGPAPTPGALAEAGRLTAAFRAFDWPGSGPAPEVEFCAAALGGWDADVPIQVTGGTRSVLISTRARTDNGADQCRPGAPSDSETCRVETLDDGTVVRIGQHAPDDPSMPAMAGVTAWRPDGTVVHVTETGHQNLGGTAAPRQLDDAALIAIATAPQLRVNWASDAPPDASNVRAAELSAVIEAAGILPPAMTARPGLRFAVSQGGYKLSADLIDADGEGHLFINLGAPVDGRPDLACDGIANCELITLPNGRPALLERDNKVDPPLQTLRLTTIAEDGTYIHIDSTNQAERAIAEGKNPPQTGPTRPTPPLDQAALIRMVTLPDLHW